MSTLEPLFECSPICSLCPLLRLVESEVLMVFPEALTADVQLPLADEADAVAADDAAPGTFALDDFLVRLPQFGVAHGLNAEQVEATVRGKM